VAVLYYLLDLFLLCSFFVSKLVVHAVIFLQHVSTLFILFNIDLRTLLVHMRLFV